MTGASVNSSVIALPLLPGSSGRLVYVAAASINTAGVIVGGSSENINTHGVIWKNGQVQDLNTLIPSGNSQTLNAATLITDQGWILGSIGNRVAGPFRNAPNVSNNIWYTGIRYILIPK